MNMNQIAEMKNTDIKTVDKSTLVDIKNVIINPAEPPEKKAKAYMEQIKNPYCFLCNGYAVKIDFSDNNKSIEDCFLNYIDSLI